MAEKFRSPAYIDLIEPYRAGKPISELAREKGLDPDSILKLASNENPLGAPASALEGAKKAASRLSLYPDGNAYELKSAVAKRFGVPIDWVVVGNGSDELMGITCEALVEPGTKTLFSQYYFSVYRIDTLANGGEPVEIPARGFDIDLDAIADAVDDKVRVIFLTTPNNPTGRILTGAQMEKFMERVPSSVIVVLDEAYRDFVPPEQRFDSIAMVKRYPNLMVTRTFSKAYGLAGLRAGFGIAQPELVAFLNRIRPPFNCNAIAQAAAAACLNDDAFLERVYKMNREGVRQLQERFAALGREFVPSLSNFVLVKIGPKAPELNQWLLDRGIIIRPCASFGLPEWIRVSVGTGPQNERFLSALAEFLAGA
ncbi:MAG: histidinol-phosphate transaminase [Mesosutterella sp.]|nr:histidinol-phosphate transaminase [Mesosutterella sp.]